VQHPWDPMVEIPTPPERGCGWLSYVWICCSCAEHREDSHPMCRDAWNCTCEGYARSSIDDLSLAIRLGVEGMDLVSLVSSSDQRLEPECATVVGFLNQLCSLA
jgi:hypothetical protein